jgi:hypothetical protein
MPSCAFWIALALATASTWVQAQCPPAAWPLADLQRLKADNWKMQDATQRQALALALPACLDHTDPLLRDGMAFEGLSAWLRGKQLTPSTQLAIYQSQVARLPASVADPSGFAKPFAALVLSEVARADRLEPVLSADQRASLVDTGTQYLRGVRDYRGFVTGEGWRHGVAHAADLMLQLALNPAVDRAQLMAITDAVRSQIAPQGEHFYIYGESDRLARPILYAARRGLMDAGYWNDFVAAIAAPAPLKSWDEAFDSQHGLARLHNVKSFLRALDAGVRLSADTAAQAAFETPLPLALKGLP